LTHVKPGETGDIAPPPAKLKKCFGRSPVHELRWPEHLRRLSHDYDGGDTPIGRRKSCLDPSGTYTQLRRQAAEFVTIAQIRKYSVLGLFCRRAIRLPKLQFCLSEIEPAGNHPLAFPQAR
jgi:hypothetical protein